MSVFDRVLQCAIGAALLVILGSSSVQLSRLDDLAGSLNRVESSVSLAEQHAAFLRAQAIVDRHDLTNRRRQVEHEAASTREALAECEKTLAIMRETESVLKRRPAGVSAGEVHRRGDRVESVGDPE